MQEPKWPLFYSNIDPVWSLLIIRTCCTLGRSPRTKETLPDFREWRRVTRHPRVFRGLMGCQRDPWDRGVTTNQTQSQRTFAESSQENERTRCTLTKNSTTVKYHGYKNKYI